MKQKDLLRELHAIAARKGLRLEHVRSGKHAIYRLGDHTIPVPRHREINELTARQILKDAEGV